MKKSLLGSLGSLLLGIGSVSLISPIFFYWWLHGDDERYLWIISGPAPYSNLGSGPYQLYIAIFAVVIGILFIASSSLIKKNIAKTEL